MRGQAELALCCSSESREWQSRLDDEFLSTKFQWNGEGPNSIGEPQGETERTNNDGGRALECSAKRPPSRRLKDASKKPNANSVIAFVQQTSLSKEEKKEPHKRLKDYWSDTVYDVRYTVRTLGRDPGFATVSILILTLAIGATSLSSAW